MGCGIPPCQHRGRLAKARHSPNGALWQHVWRVGGTVAGDFNAAVGVASPDCLPRRRQTRRKSYSFVFLSIPSARIALALPVRVRLHRLDPQWRQATFALRPSDGETRALCRKLQATFGEKSACSLLGVPVQTWRCWQNGRRRASGAALKAIWLVYSLIFRPDTVTCVFDVATWGRFAVVRKPHEPSPEDWSI